MQPVMQSIYLFSITFSDALQLKTGASMMSGRGDIQSLPCFNREAGPALQKPWTLSYFNLKPANLKPARPSKIRSEHVLRIKWLGSAAITTRTLHSGSQRTSFDIPSRPPDGLLSHVTSDPPSPLVFRRGAGTHPH